MATIVRLPSGQNVAVESTVVMIGSDTGCDVSLPNETTVRPQHAKIRKIADRWFIESQGDWLIRVGQAEPGRSSWLAPGDSIRLAPNGPIVVFQPNPSTDQSPNPPAPVPAASEPTPPDQRSEQHGIAIQQLRMKRAEVMVREKDMLPRLYQVLGNHVFEKRLFEDKLATHFRKLEKLQDKLAALKSEADGNAQAGGVGLTEERKKALARTETLSLNANSLFSRLGKAAYSEFGNQAGPAGIVEPIETCLARIEELRPEIRALANTVNWPMTPQNFLICGLIVVFASSLYLITRLVAAN